MANPYVTKEVTKIVKDQGLEYPKNFALASAWVIANFKGTNIKIFDVSGSSSLCDYNVIASMQNTMQAKSAIDEIQYNLKQNGGQVLSLEGLSDGEWILLDLGDVIVHLFQEHSRDIYDLDSLWRNFPQVSIPAEYYFGEGQININKSQEPTDNYF
jgi:ribosome-associated protein